jgi:integrase
MSYYQRKAKDGQLIPGRWEVKVYFGKRQVVRRAHTEREAKQIERELLNERDELIARATQSSEAQLDPTVHELAAMWWERHLAARRRSPNTLEYYSRQLQHRIVGTEQFRKDRPNFPWLGELRISELSRLKLDDWIAAMLRETITLADGSTKPMHGPRSINAAIRTLKAIWNKALDWELTEIVNRAAKLEEVDEPQRSTGRKALSPEDVLAIAAQCRSDRDRTIVVTLGFTGMRLGEAAGLTWDAVDLADNTITVNQQWDEHGPRPTKTKATGTVPIMPTLARALEWWQAHSHLPSESDTTRVVFPSSINPNKPFDRNSWRTKIFNPAVTRAGFPGTTPHHLRHTFRSLLRLVGADHTLAKELLRHSSDAMSHYYAHTYEGEGRAAVERIDKLVGGG